MQPAVNSTSAPAPRAQYVVSGGVTASSASPEAKVSEEEERRTLVAAYEEENDIAGYSKEVAIETFQNLLLTLEKEDYLVDQLVGMNSGQFADLRLPIIQVLMTNNGFSSRLLKVLTYRVESREYSRFVLRPCIKATPGLVEGLDDGFIIENQLLPKIIDSDIELLDVDQISTLVVLAILVFSKVDSQDRKDRLFHACGEFLARQVSRVEEPQLCSHCLQLMQLSDRPVLIESVVSSILSKYSRNDAVNEELYAYVIKFVKTDEAMVIELLKKIADTVNEQ